jgi:hypothetical protein
VFDPKLVVSGKGKNKKNKKDNADEGSVTLPPGQAAPSETPTTPGGDPAPTTPGAETTPTPTPDAEGPKETETDANGLTEEDRLVGQEALGAFTAQLMGEDKTAEDLALALQNGDPEMAKNVFGLRVIKTKSADAIAATETAPAINPTFDLAIDVALRFIDANTQKQEVAQLTSTMTVQQGGIPVESVPTDAMVIEESADDETSETDEHSVKFYATCVDVECTQVLLLIKLLGADQNGELTDEKYVAFKLEEDSTGSSNGKMFILASSAGANNIKDIDSEEVQNELLTAGIVIQPKEEESSILGNDIGPGVSQEEMDEFRNSGKEETSDKPRTELYEDFVGE